MINKLIHLVKVAHSVVREQILKPSSRSSEWPSVRRKYLLEHNECAACKSKTLLQVHHKKPFHSDPTLELNPDNFITLCMGPNECHILIGHGDSYKCYNPNVARDAQEALAYPERLKTIQTRAKVTRLINAPGN